MPTYWFRPTGTRAWSGRQLGSSVATAVVLPQLGLQVREFGGDVSAGQCPEDKTDAGANVPTMAAAKSGNPDRREPEGSSRTLIRGGGGNRHCRSPQAARSWCWSVSSSGYVLLSTMFSGFGARAHRPCRVGEYAHITLSPKRRPVGSGR